jgi:YegS/Rv2252/BmrU family lipid kinase
MSMDESGVVPRVYVIINPSSGNATIADVRQALSRHFVAGCPPCEIHEVQPDDDLKQLAGEAVKRGADVVVAAGGDGTVSMLADGLVGTSARLGIIPLGTTNVLARELSIPIDLDGSCALLAGANAAAEIDAMKVGEGHYFTQIGIGVDALMIRDTTTESKKRFGSIAYLWTAAVRLSGFRARRFSIAADDARSRPRALQVILANSGALGTSGLRWGPDVRIDDGRIDVCILRARTALDYLSVAWNVARGRHHEDRNIDILPATRAIAVNADRPLPVQADGEIIGRTPIEVQVIPRALRVVVPAPAANA